MGYKKEEIALRKKEEVLPTGEVLSKAISLEADALTKRTVTETRIPLKDLEKIYRLDGLVFGIINKYVRDVTGTGYSILASDESSRQMIDTFCRDKEIGFQKMLRFAIRDSLIYGFHLTEIVYTRDRSEIKKLLRIDPTTVEFTKEKGYVKKDKYGYPESFTYTDPETSKPTEIPKDRVAFFTFFPLREGDIGISPLEVLYRPILFKLNVEEATGEDLWRRGFPPMQIQVGSEKHYPSEKEIEQLSKDVIKLKSRTAFVFPYWTKIEAVDTGKPADVEGYLNYFTNLIRECLGIPRIEARETGAVDYERTVLALQLELAEQVEEQLFNKIVKLKGLKEIPRMKFAEQSAAMRLSKARRIGVYSRAGILTRDRMIERDIRIEEGLDTTMLTEENEEWRQRQAERAKRARLSQTESDSIYGKEEE